MISCSRTHAAKLHLTLGGLGLCLFSEEEEMAIAEAVKVVMHKIQQETLGKDPCHIQLVCICIKG